MLDSNQPFGYEKLKEITSHDPHDVQASLDITEHFGGKSNILGKEKVQRTKLLLLFSSYLLLKTLTGFYRCLWLDSIFTLV